MKTTPCVEKNHPIFLFLHSLLYHSPSVNETWGENLRALETNQQRQQCVHKSLHFSFSQQIYEESKKEEWMFPTRPWSRNGSNLKGALRSCFTSKSWVKNKNSCSNPPSLAIDGFCSNIAQPCQKTSWINRHPQRSSCRELNKRSSDLKCQRAPPIILSVSRWFFHIHKKKCNLEPHTFSCIVVSPHITTVSPDQTVFHFLLIITTGHISSPKLEKSSLVSPYPSWIWTPLLTTNTYRVSPYS